MKCFRYSDIDAGQEQLVSDMVREASEEFAAPGYSPDGIETFRCSIQEMQIDYYNEIYELWSNTPGMGLSDADTYENIHKFLIRNRKLSYVCKCKNKIVGTILCGHDGRRGYIYHVTVVEEYRDRGIGRLLVEKSLERLKVEGINKCHLFVFADNTIGNAFWKALGWIKREDIFVYSR